MNKTITLAHGNGGVENSSLISKVFYKVFENEILIKSEDAAILQIKKNIAYSTDSFAISPLFFKGGDIGKLAVCGTCNDIAMMEAKPKYMSIGVILEEGFEIYLLEKIVNSIKKELKINDTLIVSGDTKVMPKGTLDKIAKYPVMFTKADLIIFTKTDLLPYFDYDLQKEKKFAKKLKPNVDILELNIKDEKSIKKVANWIKFKLEMR